MEKKIDLFEKLIIFVPVVLLLMLMIHEMLMVRDGSSSQNTDVFTLQKRNEQRVTNYSNRLQKKPYITIREFKTLTQKADNLATQSRYDIIGLNRDLSGDYIEKLAKNMIIPTLSMATMATSIRCTAIKQARLNPTRLN